MKVVVARRMVVLAGGIALLAACAAPPPPPPPPTVVNLILTTTDDVNPTTSGQGAPLVLRVYQLSSPAGFEKAEFFKLYNQDAATLGADLVKKDEFLLAPNTTKKSTLEPGPTVQVLGLFGAYRDFGNATWHAVVEIPAHQTTEITVKADAHGVSATSKPVPPPPKPQS